MELARKLGVAVTKINEDIDFDRMLVAMVTDIEPYLAFARDRRLLTPKSDAALRRLMQGDIRLSSAERNALKYMLERMLQAGFELPVSPARTDQPV